MIYAEKKGSHWVPLLIMAVLVLCCSVLFYAVPMKVAAPPEQLSSAEMPWFSLENGILYFDASRYTGSNQLTVPSTIEGADVMAIGDGCFRDCGELTAIFLPESLKAIGEEAFRNCTALRGIQIPESVAFIGTNAFSNCSALEAIRISNKMKHIAIVPLTDVLTCATSIFLENSRNGLDFTKVFWNQMCSFPVKMVISTTAKNQTDVLFFVQLVHFLLL